VASFDSTRKINGQMTVGQALAVADAAKSTTDSPLPFKFKPATTITATSSPKSTTSDFSIKITPNQPGANLYTSGTLVRSAAATTTPAGNHNTGLPYINPAINNVLDKFIMTVTAPQPRTLLNVNNVVNTADQLGATGNKSHTVKIITANAALNNATNNPNLFNFHPFFFPFPGFSDGLKKHSFSYLSILFYVNITLILKNV
jgi:hypothetical protein